MVKMDFSMVDCSPNDHQGEVKLERFQEHL